MSADLEQQARELADQLFSSQGARIAAIPLIHRALQRVRDEGARENRELRFMCAMGSARQLYTDDGEIQDNTEHPFIDWKRDSVADIQQKLLERNLKNPEVRRLLAMRPTHEKESP